MRNRIVSRSRWLAPLVVALVAAACGDNKSASSPTAPSAPGQPTSPAMAYSSTVISGTVSGTSTVSSSLVQPMATGLTISITGTNISSVVDTSGHFTLTGVPTGDVTLQISGGSVNATVTLTGVADHEQIHLNLIVNGSTADVDADERQAADNTLQIEGRVTSVGTGTLQVAGLTITVPTGIPIAHGGTAVTLADIHVGDRVHVQATGVLSGVITATRIELQSGPPGSGPVVTPPGGGNGGGNGGGSGPRLMMNLSGMMRAMTGTCPSLTFSVSSTTVVTDASTKFHNTTCASLAAGNIVNVVGRLQSGGSVLASQVMKR